MPRVNPAVLRWARESAGLSEAEAAKKVGLNDARGVAAAARMRLLENGEKEPSRSLLLQMAKQYRRPLLTFYLAEPPPPGDRPEDFRALPDRRPESEPLVQALTRDVRARQSLVRGVLQDEEAPRLAFIASRTLAERPAAVAAALVRDLDFRLDAFRAAPTIDLAFTYARGCAEAAGVFVLLIGDLGSHHTEIDTEAFRGFAMADPIAPFVVINDRDAHSAWTFTLFHELAHLWIGASGVSGARAETRIERFCNEVASLVLLPAAEAEALRLPPWETTDELAAALTRLARPLRLSRTLMAFRLYQANVFSEGRWEELRAHFREEWRAERRRRKADRAPDARGGPNLHVVRRHHLGAPLLALVGRALNDGTLTSTKAGTVLGVRGRNVETLLGTRVG